MTAADGSENSASRFGLYGFGAPEERVEDLHCDACTGEAVVPGIAGGSLSPVHLGFEL